MKAATTRVVEERVQTINIVSNVTAAVAGGLAGAGILSAPMTIAPLTSLILPVAAKAGAASTSLLSASFAGGAAVAAVAAVAGIATGTVQAIKAAEAEKKYNELIAQKGQPVNLAGFNSDENKKPLIATALLDLMANSVSLLPSS